MSLRRKLILLHTGFAVFAVVTASATIYGVQLHVRDAVRSFEHLINQSNLVERLRVAAQAQLVELEMMVHRRRTISASYLERRDAFFTRLGELANFAGNREAGSTLWSVLQLGQSLEQETGSCLELARAGRWQEAEEMLASQKLPFLWGALDSRLDALKTSVEDARQQPVNQVLRSNMQLIGVTGLIGMSCAGLIIVGAILVRRWLITPIAELQVATREYAKGNLTHHVQPRTDDELGSLGTALNEMASSVGASEAKYRSLFENLRDAVIICALDGTIVECHDGDTAVLGTATDKGVGARISDIWPDWRTEVYDWEAVVARVAGAGQRIHLDDVELLGAREPGTIIDLVAYPVEYSGIRHAAIVLRDVTERHRLRSLARRAETMEATETFARGIAHDFRNLLNSAVTTLSLLESERDNPNGSDRLQTALRACRQAASLSRRLLSFATSDEGSPQVFDLSETVKLIVGSLDEPFLAPLSVRIECSRPVFVRMDRDHLTQVILNLIRNAREAMPDGGILRITTDSVIAANPVAKHSSGRHALLTVSDTGCGMTAEVRERLFEPLFTTKGRGSDGARGMGLATVYAAVRNAGGFIHVDSEVGIGTTFQVFLPGK